jgi:hypothetical protein
MLRLHVIEDVPMRDVAAVLGIPLQTAHTRLRSGRRNFARLLRRLATVADPRMLAAIGPETLRASDIEPAADERRRRAVARARALFPVAGPAGGGEARPPGRARPWPAATTLLWATAGMLALVVLPGARAMVVGGAKATAAERSPGGKGHRRAARDPATVPRFVVGLPTPRTWQPPAAPPAPALPEASRLPPGPIAHWSFDDGNGSRVVRDGSGNGGDCFLRGPEGAHRWTDGITGGALELTGETWVECPQLKRLAGLSRELTIALWIKRTGKEGHVRALVSRQRGIGGRAHFNLGFKGEHLRLRGMVQGAAVFGRSTLARSRWYHVAGTVNREGLARVFVDGVEVGQACLGGEPNLGGGSNPLIIGATFSGTPGPRPGERLRGMVDDLVIYDRALAPDEIRALADRGRAANGPVATTVVVPRPGAVYLWAEAEHAEVTEPFEVGHDPDASGGEYLSVSRPISSKTQVPSEGRSTVHFQLATPATFKLWGRIIAPDAAHDSFWIRMDQGPWIKWNDILAGATWHWDAVNDDDTNRTAYFDLAAGGHDLTVAYRENGARLDRLLLTNDLAFTPTDRSAGGDRDFARN